MEKKKEQLDDKEAYFTFQELQEAREEVIQKMLDQIKDEKLKETIRNKMKEEEEIYAQEQKKKVIEKSKKTKV